MGSSCFSKPNEKNQYNTDLPPNKSPQLPASITSTTTKKNSLSSINESGPIIINQSGTDCNYTSHVQYVLTEKALEQHNMKHHVGMDSMSLSSLSSTENDDNILKNIGNQLVSMKLSNRINTNTKSSSISTQTDDNNNILKQIGEQLSSIKIKSNGNDNINNHVSLDGNKLVDHQTNQSSSLSSTPIPNDYDINQIKPKYNKLSSYSYPMRRIQQNKNIFKDGTQSVSDSDSDDIEFPDVFHFKIASV